MKPRAYIVQPYYTKLPAFGQIIAPQSTGDRRKNSNGATLMPILVLSVLKLTLKFITLSSVVFVFLSSLNGRWTETALAGRSSPSLASSPATTHCRTSSWRQRCWTCWYCCFDVNSVGGSVHCSYQNYQLIAKNSLCWPHLETSGFLWTI